MITPGKIIEILPLLPTHFSLWECGTNSRLATLSQVLALTSYQPMMSPSMVGWFSGFISHI